jgi:hypothetical protein
MERGSWPRSLRFKVTTLSRLGSSLAVVSASACPAELEELMVSSHPALPSFQEQPRGQ